MKLLLDANLSWRLIKMLSSDYDEIIHVNSLDLKQPAKDFDIFNYASKNGYCIVTNDEDFKKLLQSVDFLPKVILLKIGNQSTKFIAGLLTFHKNDIVDFIKSKEYGHLEIY